MSIKPYIRNEWGKLKEIIVGRPEFAQIPTIRDKSLHTIDYANYTDDQFRKIPYGTYPNWMIEETKEDLDSLSITLEGLGVKVHRPSLIDWSEKYYDKCLSLIAVTTEFTAIAVFAFTTSVSGVILTFIILLGLSTFILVAILFYYFFKLSFCKSSGTSSTIGRMTIISTVYPWTPTTIMHYTK